MIESVDKDLRRWADWVLEPAAGTNLGYGGSVLQRIVEGRGQILPGAPSRVVVVRVDMVAIGVEQWLTQLERSKKHTIKVFYLSTGLTNEEKAKKLKISRRGLYDRIHNLHLEYQRWWGPKGNK
jgi:hypothetical protein